MSYLNLPSSPSSSSSFFANSENVGSGTQKKKADFSSAHSLTFSIENEGHTLGNILRSILIRKENVIFAGYSLPHPMQNKMNLRIQTKQNSAVCTLHDALSDVENICDNLLELYTKEEEKILKTNDKKAGTHEDDDVAGNATEEEEKKEVEILEEQVDKKKKKKKK